MPVRIYPVASWTTQHLLDKNYRMLSILYATGTTGTPTLFEGIPMGLLLALTYATETG